ncbi:MAG: ribosome-binding factor A [Candidatus Paceibacterota bacterium]|jgi:ribosome-binding factor A
MDINNEDFNPDFAGKTERQIKIGLTIRSIAQDFFQKESSGTSLITVTRADISRDLKNTNIFITVLPDSKEEQALNFAKRMRTELRTEIKKKLQIRTIPMVEVKIDKGEKARQIMDTVFKKVK